MKTSDFFYDLPQSSIAQTPVYPRHNSRLLVLNRGTSELTDSRFWDISEFLKPGDLLVINHTKVIPARVFAKKETGGKVELLLLRREDELTWEAMVGGKRVNQGKKLFIENGPQAEVVEVLDGPRRRIRFAEPVEPYLDQVGQMPLPPYIHTRLEDQSRYQTVYADPERAGSAAAPTAGLHFTPELMDKLNSEGIRFAKVTLHVGLDTFAPVTEDDPEEHQIHTEWCEMPRETVDLIHKTRRNGGRVIAVGTTSVRTLETAARYAAENGMVNPDTVVASFAGATSLFILPGYQFKVVDAMITNFHLPNSTLLMLVSAFAGRKRILSAYQHAVDDGYRFFSFGDAMLIS